MRKLVWLGKRESNGNGQRFGGVKAGLLAGFFLSGMTKLAGQLLIVAAVGMSDVYIQRQKKWLKMK